MAQITFDDARALKATYEDLYRVRHEAFRALRRYWHGDYWKQADSESGRPVLSIFRDLTGNQSDVGPDLKIVYNIIQAVCVKYQTFLSPLPQIRVIVDQPGSTQRRAAAERKQRYLYGCWDAGDMTKIFSKMGWYLPLMGDCYLGIHPDFDRNIPMPILRSPEFAYPIPTFDKNGEEAVLFAWKVHESIAARSFVEYQAPIQQLRQQRQGKFRRGQSPDPHMEIMEYSDSREWRRWIAPLASSNVNDVSVGAVEVNGVEHNLGFNLFDHLKFIDVPDEVWGHGAVEQAINLNEMENTLYSLLMQAVIENVFPRLVLEDASKAPEEIESGPGAIIPLHPGGKAYFLQPEGPMIQQQAEFVRTNELNIRNATGMPGVAFGESPASSIVTGKAVNELQGAGTGSMVEMVQGVGIGDGIVSWNVKAITIGQTMFRDDTMNLYGAEYQSFLALEPKRFQVTMKGKDLVGSPRNDVVFSPALNQHEKLVQALQGIGGGLWSKRYSREQLGVIDNEAMVEDIFAEAVEDGVLAAMLQQFQQAPDPAQATGVEDTAFAFVQGQTNVTPTAHPLTQIGPPPGAPPPGGPALPPGGAAAPPGPPGAAGAAVPAPPAAQQAPQQSQTLTVDAVAAAIQAVPGVQGKVYLIGEIVQRGQTQAGFEVAITDPADQQTLTAGLPQFKGRMQFIHVDGKPSERFLDVSPGATLTPGGGGPGNPQALSGVFQQ